MLRFPARELIIRAPVNPASAEKTDKKTDMQPGMASGKATS
jgi:hypothetical protein